MTAPPKPLRIQRLTLTDFRAFPGPAPQSFDLEGKNLLVYGKNGAGKSSLFHALREFFSLKPARRLDDYRNVFSKALPVAEASIVDELPKGFRLPEGELQSRQVTTPLDASNRSPEQGELPLEGGKRAGEGGKRPPQGGKRSLPDLPPEMVQDGELVFLFPESPNHALQAYKFPIRGKRAKGVNAEAQTSVLARTA